MAYLLLIETCLLKNTRSVVSQCWRMDTQCLYKAQGKYGPYGRKLMGVYSNNKNGSFLESILKVNIMLYQTIKYTFRFLSKSAFTQCEQRGRFSKHRWGISSLENPHFTHFICRYKVVLTEAL